MLAGLHTKRPSLADVLPNSSTSDSSLSTTKTKKSRYITRPRIILLFLLTAFLISSIRKYAATHDTPSVPSSLWPSRPPKWQQQWQSPKGIAPISPELDPANAIKQEDAEKIIDRKSCNQHCLYRVSNCEEYMCGMHGATHKSMYGKELELCFMTCQKKSFPCKAKCRERFSESEPVKVSHNYMIP